MITRDYTFNSLGSCQMVTSIVKLDSKPCVCFQLLDFPGFHYSMTILSSHLTLDFVNLELRTFMNRATLIFMQGQYDDVLKGRFAEVDSIDNRLTIF